TNLPSNSFTAENPFISSTLDPLDFICHVFLPRPATRLGSCSPHFIPDPSVHRQQDYQHSVNGIEHQQQWSHSRHCDFAAAIAPLPLIQWRALNSIRAGVVFPIKLLQNVEGLLALSLIGNQTLSV